MARLTLIVFLLVLFSCSKVEEKTKEEKIQTLHEIGYSNDSSNAKQIEPYLKDKDAEVVSFACYYIGYLRAREYIPTLVAFLSDGDDQIVNMAGAGLAEMVDSRDVWILKDLYPLLHHKFLLARLSAIEAIGKIGSETSLDKLIEIFDASSTGQKARIISALGEIGSSKALPLLNQYLLEINKMDFSVPNKGGGRGVDFHPEVLKAITEEAILAIEKGRA